MGYTVTTGKQAAAFARENGDIVYVLFEKTHESNVFPQTPNWCAIAIGNYDDVMLRIFRHATACEGGMLKGSGNRDIKPENYISAWQRELANPVLMDDFTINLSTGGWASPLDREKLEEVFAVLQQIGRNDLVDAIRENGKVDIELYRDVEVVLALYGTNKLLSPWRILKHAEWRTMNRPELAPTGRIARIADFNPPKVCVMANKVGQFDNNVIVRLGDGQAKSWGWPYAAVGEYMLTVVYQCEMQRMGCHKRLIAEFREACHNAPAIPDDTKLSLYRDAEGVSKWNSEVFDKLVEKLGGAQGSTEFETTLGKVKAVEDGMRDLDYMNPNQVVWHIQEAIPAEPDSQLSLLAA